jgi:predicted SPOUT superfamily RNA methylase MTH1
VIIHQNGRDESNDSPAKKMKSDVQPDDELDVDTSKPSALFKPTRGRDWTVSIALPGSWLLNAKKPDHKIMQVGRIARAAAVFCVDEIVVFDDDPMTIDPKVVNPKYIGKGKGKQQKTKQEVLNSILEEDEPWQNPDQFLYHVLTYAECPPHLRQTLFAMHQNLSQAGCLPSMDMPHHLRSHEWCRYREGAIIGPAPAPPVFTPNGRKLKTTRHQGEYAYVECGLPYPVRVPTPEGMPIEANMRATIRFANQDPPASWPQISKADCDALEAIMCSSALPREENGYYWGYTTRRAASISDVLNQCEYTGGYDMTIGTSERGVPIQSIMPGNTLPSHNPALEPCKHLLIVFGGVAGLEPALASDPVLKDLGTAKPTDLFDFWVNLVPGQGSRTIRTEEAVEIGLCALKPFVDSMSEE